METVKTIQKIFKIQQPESVAMVLPSRQSPEEVSDYSVKKVITTRELTAWADNSTADKAYVPMVLYNTDATPPAANTVPIGTIYIQYTP